MGWAGGSAFTFFASIEANVKADWAVDGFDDLQQGGFASSAEDGKAAEFASARGDELCVNEGLKHFREETLGGVSGNSEIRQEGAVLFREGDEMDHDTDGVIGCTCELHRGIAFLKCRIVRWMRLHALPGGMSDLDRLRPNLPMRAG